MVKYKVYSDGQDWTFADGVHCEVDIEVENQKRIPEAVRYNDIQKHGQEGDMELGDILMEEPGVLIWEADGEDDGPMVFIALAAEAADSVSCRLLNALVAI